MHSRLGFGHHDRLRTGIAVGLGAALVFLAAACSTPADGSASTKPSTVPTTAASTHVTTGDQPSQTQPPVSTTTSLDSAGPIPITLLSTAGPINADGPFAATSRTALDAAMAAAAGKPDCLGVPCWADAHPASRSLLIALRPAPTSCYSLAGLHAALSGPMRLVVQITTTYACADAGGSGQAAIFPAILLAVPLSALPATGKLEISIDDPTGAHGEVFVDLQRGSAS